MLGSTKNNEERKMKQKTNKQYDFFLVWFHKEKGKEKKISKKWTEKIRLNFSYHFWQEKEQKISRRFLKKKIF